LLEHRITTIGLVVDITTYQKLNATSGIVLALFHPSKLLFNIDDQFASVTFSTSAPK
jgi:hypothetical protein